jgi:predicted DNA-binding transcriptional regulator YafY
MKYLKFSIQVEENWELEQFLLKYATDIMVVSPQSVRDRIENLLEEGLNYYAKSFKVHQANN